MHHVASQTQHQSGSASASAQAAGSAAAVASGAAANACGLVKLGGGESNVLIYDEGGGIFVVSATLGNDRLHQGDFDKGTVEVCTHVFERKNRRFDVFANCFQKGVRTHQVFSIFFHAANHRCRLSVWRH